MLIWLARSAVIANFVLFGFALRLLFSRPDGVRPAMSLLQSLGTAVALLHLVLHLTGGSRAQFIVVTALVLAVAAGGLFTWAWRTVGATPPSLAFSRDIPTRVFSTGPYRYMCHPMYASYALNWLGSALLLGSVPGWLSIAPMLGLYFCAAIIEERKLASAEAIGPTYRRYRRATLFRFILERSRE